MKDGSLFKANRCLVIWGELTLTSSNRPLICAHIVRPFDESLAQRYHKLVNEKLSKFVPLNVDRSRKKSEREEIFEESFNKEVKIQSEEELNISEDLFEISVLIRKYWKIFQIIIFILF